MRILFLDPPTGGGRVPERVFGCTYGHYPIPNIFLLTAAAVLEGRGHEVRYIDAPSAGLTESDIQAHLRENPYQAYVLYSVNLSRELDAEVRRKLREVSPESVIVSIGPAPTYYTNEFLDDGRSFAIRGEPDLALADLLEDPDHPEKVPGASYLRAGGPTHVPAELIVDLDFLPHPARHLLDRGLYYNPKFRSSGGRGAYTAVLTSRGCPYQCVYCVPNSLSFSREIECRRAKGTKPPWRARSASDVLEELRELSEDGYARISFIDDEFTIDKQRVMEICRGLSGLGMVWGCLSRPDSVDDQLAREMAAAGCSYVDVGVESLDQEVLDDINKNIEVEEIHQGIACLKRAGIRAKLNILLGSSPLETLDSLRHTVDEAIRMRPDSIMFGICNPFPGTVSYQTALERSYFVKGDYYPVDVQRESTVCLPHLSKQTLEREVRRANRKFFLSPRFILRNLGRISSPSYLIRGIKAMWKKLAP
ncbi:radical SAM protein [Candidatus Fermentibacteria bacterium]|nr:radical SAM protein [Candidatus Fermentibacteria bacterium]